MRIYQRIEKDFHFSYKKEIEARDYLSDLIGNEHLKIEDLKKEIGKEVYVAGFSPYLEDEIEIIPKNAKIIAADEAGKILKEYGIIPDIIMTDLDGDIEDLFSSDIIFGIHAHGDNIEKLNIARNIGRKFGTTQIEPVWNIYNFGGFTDGDRCVFLAYYFNAKIHIIGFDFEKVRDKRGKNMEIKKKKLKWAKRLIGYLEKRGANIVWESLNHR